MTTATKQMVRMHCEDGDVSQKVIADILNDAIGRTEILEGIKKEARIEAEKYGIDYLESLSGCIMSSYVEEEKSRLYDRLTGFFDAYMFIKTGKRYL